MAIESEAAEQSVGIALQVAKTGGELALGATKLGAVGVAKLMAIIYRKVKEGKELSPGEKKLQDLTKDGDNLHLFTVPEDNLDLVHAALREYGIPYAVVDQNQGMDDTVDVLVRERDAARAARALEKRRVLEEPEGNLFKPKHEKAEPEDDIPENFSELFVEAKTSFDQMVDSFAGEDFAGKEKIFCNIDNPDDYVLVKTEKEKHQNHTIYSTTFTAYRDGQEQICSEYRHGNFIRRTDAEGINTSEEGKKHWENVKNELKAKCAFHSDVLVFASEEKYRAYLEARKKELAARNTEAYAKKFVENVTRNPRAAKTESADLSERGFRLRKKKDAALSERRRSVKTRLREWRERLKQERTLVAEPMKRRKRGRNR